MPNLREREKEDGRAWVVARRIFSLVPAQLHQNCRDKLGGQRRGVLARAPPLNQPSVPRGCVDAIHSRADSPGILSHVDPSSTHRLLSAISLGGKEVLHASSALDGRCTIVCSRRRHRPQVRATWSAPWYSSCRIRPAGLHPQNHEVLALVAPQALRCCPWRDSADSGPELSSSKPSSQSIELLGRPTTSAGSTMAGPPLLARGPCRGRGVPGSAPEALTKRLAVGSGSSLFCGGMESCGTGQLR